VLPVPRPEPTPPVRPAPEDRVAAAAKAARSPSALVLAVVGAGACVLASAPLSVTLFVAVFLWACRVAFAALTANPPRPEPILPYSLNEPWRGYVLASLTLGQRFAGVANQREEGPIHDQLMLVGQRIDDGVHRAWEVARKGDALDQAVAALDVPHTVKQAEELGRERERAARTPGSDAEVARLDSTLGAINAQLATADRLRTVSSAAQDRLRVLNAQLGEAVAHAVELSLTDPTDADFSRLSGNVDSAVRELEALRQGLDEAAGPPAG
jgi:hypothetical protein